jgi:NAD(P)-dependent dehydrogenase (short-subunit alcohol dehydrogenase family)
MTDLKKHLPEIFKLIRKEFSLPADEFEFDEAWKARFRQQLTDFLPASYGVATGRVTNAQGELSPPVDIILYDRTIGPGFTPASDAIPVQNVLAVFEFALQPTLPSLTELLEKISSVKRLKKTYAPPSANKFSFKPFLPLGIIFVRGLKEEWPTESLCLNISALLRQHEPTLRPDYLFALDLALQYRNPAMTDPALTGYEIGFCREPDLIRAQICYVCKQTFSRRHFFYNQLCPTCGDFNYIKRMQTVDMTGRIALVTGARVKIGYAVALKLLRTGATVIATTRFPHDAALRYSKEPDFTDWQQHLHIYGLDLRHLPGIQAFIAKLYSLYSHLDILINNAAQTVRRPPSFYAHLLPFEQTPVAQLPPQLWPLLDRKAANQVFIPGRVELQAEANPTFLSATLSQIPLVEGDELPDKELFPVGQYDCDNQQLDLRQHNSWTMTLEEISIPEIIEVQMINSIAPTIFASQLKALMLKSPAHDKYIINVAAVEGQFSQTKRGVHPHTNMAKAALNMLTYTSAEDYAQSGIFMNSVDPGWISEQKPLDSPENQLEELPLDLLDAASRICDPIFRTIKSGETQYGLLFKDYLAASW